MACVQCNWSCEAESAGSTGLLWFLAQSNYSCLWPIKNNHRFLSGFVFVYIYVCIDGGGGVEGGAWTDGL